MNQARGEAAVMLGGVRRRVCLTLGALAEIETGLGVEGLAAAAERMKTLSARDLMVVLAAVLRGGGEARPEVEAVDPPSGVMRPGPNSDGLVSSGLLSAWRKDEFASSPATTSGPCSSSRRRNCS